MPITKAQGDRARRDAERDVRKDGARVTIVYEGNGRVDAGTGVADDGPDRVVRTYAILGGYSLRLIDGKNVQLGDQRATFADLGLGVLAPLVGGFVSGTTEGYWLYAGGDPERHPDPTLQPLAPGVRKLAVVALETTVQEGGYPLLRVLQVRG